MTSTSTIAVQVNGALRELAPGTTILEVIDQMNLDRELVAVEVNHQLVPRRELDRRQIGSGDQIEIVEFVGGG